MADASRPTRIDSRSSPLVVGIVGIDGCGKTSTYLGVVERLAQHGAVVGIADDAVRSGPGEPISPLTAGPLVAAARLVGRLAKQVPWRRMYRNLKFIELAERTKVCEHVIAHDPPHVIVTDGDPLVNSAAWSAASLFAAELTDDDDLVKAFDYLAGEEMVPISEIPHFLRAWPLVALNRLRLTKFRYPDQVYLLDLPAEVAVARIERRGKPMQAHENVAALEELGRSYRRVCRLFAAAKGMQVTVIDADRNALDQVVAQVVDGVLASMSRAGDRSRALDRPRTDDNAAIELADARALHVVATTMSGSFADQRKVGRIGPSLRRLTDRSVHVHLAGSHAEARAIAGDVVAHGGRIIVSAGGAGTFNAVLEGVHRDGAPPADLRLAFMRKGSADLIGKLLGVPDDLSGAAAAIVNAVESGATIAADVLSLQAVDPDGRPVQRRVVGFAGCGIFGEVPRFTESRAVKYYKGLLGTAFGDLGPFYVGLALGSVSWGLQRAAGRVPLLAMQLDDETLAPDAYGAVIVLNGDLGPELCLGRGLPLDGGSFRVIALRYRGLRHALRQIAAARTGEVLDAPARFSAEVRTVRRLALRPSGGRPFLVNVDGLRQRAAGDVELTVSGRVALVSCLGPGRE